MHAVKFATRMPLNEITCCNCTSKKGGYKCIAASVV